MIQISETEAFRACRVLFGSDFTLKRSFLGYLQPSGAHSAFRKQAKRTHPDCNPKISAENRAQILLFQNLNQAHQVVQNYLRQRDLTSVRNQNRAAGQPIKPTGVTPRQTQPRTAQGPLPAKPLQFGQYLYYRGLIPFNSLIGALSWQRNQRPSIGQIAQRWGWINQYDIEQILSCRKLGRFGDRAKHLGLLNSLQIRAILLHQRTRQGKIGSYFIEQGHLNSDEVNRFLGDLSEHNLKYRHGYSHHFYYHH